MVLRFGGVVGGFVVKLCGCCRGLLKGGLCDIVYKYLLSEKKGSKKKGLW